MFQQRLRVICNVCFIPSSLIIMLHINILKFDKLHISDRMGLFPSLYNVLMSNTFDQSI